MQPSTDSRAPAGLAGRGIVVTRPREQAAALAERIATAGGRALVFPAIEIAGPARPPELRGLAQAHLAIFVSPTAVRRGLAFVRAAGGWPADLRPAAVGPGTRRELEAEGVCASIAPATGADSESLLALPELATMRGRRVIIFRGEGGRELLSEELARRGAQVQIAECYRRAVPQTDFRPLLEAWAAGTVHAATVFSSETLANFLRLLGETGRAWLQRTPLFVPHRRIEDEARRRGMQEVRSAGPGDAEMIAGLVAYFATAK